MYSYIILHYKNIDETIECLTNLKKIISKDSHIIIVDNNTINKSEEKLIKKFTEDILKLDKNYGFAKANNKGIKYAQKKYNSKFYVVINNDVYITDKNFENIINKSYEKYHFDMLGPWIDSPTKESHNPFPAIVRKEQIIKEIKYCDKLIKIYQSPFLFSLLKLYISIKHLIKKPIKEENGSKLALNVPLHGCSIIFSKKYIAKYREAFYNETFLFHEEEFLYQRVLKDKLVSLYNPELKVFHKEGSSIKKDKKSERKSKLFREQERKKSLELLLKVVGE